MKITIKTSLLLAVSRWAQDDDTRPHMRVVLFKNNEVVACDGIRLVRVPVVCNDLTVAIDRDMIAAAAAAQEFTKEAAPRDNEYGGRAVEISVENKRVVIDVGRFVLHGPPCDPGSYPQVDKAMPMGRPERHPDGYGFNPKYLGAMHEVLKAAGAQDGVKVTGWSADGLGQMLFEADKGIRFVIMPMRV